MRPDERKFVRETCCKLRWPHGTTWADWSQVNGPIVDAWIDAGECRVYDEDGVILGFLVTTGEVVRALYVKRAFRGEGFGLALVLDWRPSVKQLRAFMPTPSWKRWTICHGLPWVEATEPPPRERMRAAG